MAADDRRTRGSDLSGCIGVEPLRQLLADCGDVGQAELASALIEPELHGQIRCGQQGKLLGTLGGAGTSGHVDHRAKGVSQGFRSGTHVCEL